MTDSAWSLHPQLARDTAPLGDLPLSRVLLMDDADYPWLILVPRRAGLRDIIDLDAAGQGELMAEIARASAALRHVTHCDKLNVAALGNVVAQLHIHVIARFRSDPRWPRPVWGPGPRRAYAPAELRHLGLRLGEALALHGDAPLSRPHDPA